MASRQPQEDRFWSKVEKRGPDECWPWTGNTNRKGYGLFDRDGRRTTAHRIAWELTTSLAPGPRVVCHHCDNPPCCNPYHLWLGDTTANVRDMIIKGRGRGRGGRRRGGVANQNTHKTHCVHGHEFTPENTCLSGGRRYCRACWRVRDAKRAKHRKQARLSHQQKVSA